jgi:hypothetical protein
MMLRLVETGVPELWKRKPISRAISGKSPPHHPSHARFHPSAPFSPASNHVQLVWAATRVCGAGASGGDMRALVLLGALLVSTNALAQSTLKATTPDSAEAKSLPTFELFKIVPGKLDEFMEGVAVWDLVSIAGGQPKTQVYLLKSGRYDIYDGILYKEPRVPPTPAQEAAMAAKIKELGLPTGDAFEKKFLTQIRGSSILEMEGPIDGAEWVAKRRKP